MKLGTSVRFVFPASPATHERFRSLLASRPKRAFIERPMGAYSPDEQATSDPDPVHRHHSAMRAIQRSRSAFARSMRRIS